MKRMLTMVLAFSALTFVGGATQLKAQAGAGGGGASAETNVPEPAPKKVNKPPQQMVLSGKLDDTGTIFIADNDLKSWKVNNPDAVKDHRSEHVTIDAIQDFRTGSVTVQTVRARSQKFSNAPSQN